MNKSVANAFHKGTQKDFRDPEGKEKEKEFLCKLLTSERLYTFACTLLYKMIQHAKKVGFSDDDIVFILKSYTIGEKVLLKLGYTVEQAKELLLVSDVVEFQSWNKAHDIPLMQLMGAFYKFQTSNPFVKLCIDADEALQKQFMSSVQTYFKIPQTLSYADFKTSIVEKSYGYWFYLWVITFLQSNIKNLMHRNSISDPDYIRMWDKSIEFSSGSNVSKYKLAELPPSDCKYDQLRHFDQKTLVIGSTFMVPRENGIWFNLMRLYKKEVIAGPSSSSVLSYQIIFDITKILEPTQENKILLLLCILCHYSEHYHSFSEILQSYTVDAQFKEYTMDMNDLEYIHQIAGSVLSTIGGKRRKQTRKLRKK